jgi:serine/threonine-protein kinase RsbW
MQAETEPPQTSADACAGEPGQFRLHFAANPHAVRAALQAAIACFQRQISADVAGSLELVLAETLNNIVEHGYAGRENGVISLTIVREGPGLICSVCDDGSPVPEACLAAPQLPATDVATAALPEGGFGWFLIRDLTRDLGYRRERGRNTLAFRVPLGPEG